MNLSKNFTLQELTKSDTAVRKGIDNNPNSDQIAKLQLLCENILQKVRDHFGPVVVTSGYRSPQLSVAIGSSINSQHCDAEAVDFECPGVDNAELCDWIYENLDYDQMILEYYKPENLILDGAIAHIPLINLENNSYLHIEMRMVKRNINLF